MNRQISVRINFDLFAYYLCLTLMYSFKETLFLQGFIIALIGFLGLNICSVLLSSYDQLICC